MMGGSYQMYEEEISGFFLGGGGHTEEINSLESLNADGKIIFI